MLLGAPRVDAGNSQLRKTLCWLLVARIATSTSLLISVAKTLRTRCWSCILSFCFVELLRYSATVYISTVEGVHSAMLVCLNVRLFVELGRIATVEKLL